MKDTTLLFLIKRIDGQEPKICLAMKKRGFGAGRWNGVGGKLNEGESIEDAVKREANEEIGIVVSGMDKAAELAFTFPAKPEWNQLVHVFIANTWQNEPAESEEMRPEWFAFDAIPFKDMWPDDIFWLPKVIDGNIVKASFTFGEKDAILKQEVSVVQSLS